MIPSYMVNLGIMNPEGGLCCTIWEARRVNNISLRRHVVVLSETFSMASHKKTICWVHGWLVSSGQYLLVQPWAGLITSLREFSFQRLVVAYSLSGVCGPRWIGSFGRPERFFFEEWTRVSSSIDDPWVAALSWATNILLCFLNRSIVLLSSSSCL